MNYTLSPLVIEILGKLNDFDRKTIEEEFDHVHLYALIEGRNDVLRKVPS